MSEIKEKLNKDLEIGERLSKANFGHKITLEEFRGGLSECICFNMMTAIRQSFNVDSYKNARGNLDDAREFLDKLKSETLNKLSDMGWQ